jgi:hypothetical protein
LAMGAGTRGVDEGEQRLEACPNPLAGVSLPARFKDHGIRRSPPWERCERRRRLISLNHPKRSSGRGAPPGESHRGNRFWKNQRRS